MERVMRQKLYKIIEVTKGNRLGRIYDTVMFFIILLSLVPLMFKEITPAFLTIETIATVAFILDYIFRWITADFKLKKGRASFALYPFHPMAIIDLLSILPAFVDVVPGLRALRLFRLMRTIRVIRVFKVLRYSRNMRLLRDVIRSQRDALLMVGLLAVGYIVLSALVVFNVEPATFRTFFDAIYWATVSLTTVGYGDLYPVTTAGRVVAMASSFVGIAIVALPAGIVTAGYMEEINKTSGKSKSDKK